MDYLDRTARTGSLRRDELESIYDLFSASGVVGHSRGNADAWVSEGKRWIIIEELEDVAGLVDDALHFDFNPHLAVRSIHFLIHAILQVASSPDAADQGPARDERSSAGLGMTGAEARLLCESIGLPRPVWASHLGVSLDEIRAWEFGGSDLPLSAVEALDSWHERFIALVSGLDKLLEATTEPDHVVAIYATDRAYWAGGGTPPIPASMHRAAVAAVLVSRPSVRVVWG